MISLYFINREAPIHVELSPESHDRISAFIEKVEPWEKFFELETYYGQSVWVNLANLQYVRFLEEAYSPKFDAAELRESPFRKIEPEQNEKLGDIRFFLRVWISGRQKPIQCIEVSGFEWVDLTCACQGVNCPFRVTDEEEGIDFAARTNQIDMFLGTEPERYLSRQFEVLEEEIK